KPKPLLCSASTQAVPSNRITPILFRLQYQGTHSFMAPNFGLAVNQVLDKAQEYRCHSDASVHSPWHAAFGRE
ncbi:MAG: hypothetical protein WBX11_16590, partial [Thiobacillaceae bacterium]